MLFLLLFPRFSSTRQSSVKDEQTWASEELNKLLGVFLWKDQKQHPIYNHKVFQKFIGNLLVWNSKCILPGGIVYLSWLCSHTSSQKSIYPPKFQKDCVVHRALQNLSTRNICTYFEWIQISPVSPNALLTHRENNKSWCQRSDTMGQGYRRVGSGQRKTWMEMVNKKV